MKWWYENEEEEMELYKNEDLCIECKNEFFSKPYDHRDPTPGQLGYCIKCDNCLIKDRKMEFDKSRIYSAVNADELHAGDKVIVSYNLYGLKEQVKMFTESAIDVIEVIQDEDYFNRFKVKHGESFPLAYLVERKENCTNCAGRITCIIQKPKHPELTKCCNYKHYECSEYEPKAEPKASEICINCEYYSTGYCNKHDKPTRYDNICSDFLLYKPKTEQKAEKKYRPFKDTDELIKVWCEKTPKIYDKDDEKLFMPYIWVREKGCNKSADLITCYGSKGITVRGEGMYFDTLFTMFEFLDGSPCGVEE